MRLFRLALLWPLALLAACGGNPQTASGPTVGGGRFSGTDSSASADRNGGNGSSGDSGATDGIISDPTRLKGLSPVQVRSVLGLPGFTRRDAPAEIWQYRGRACTLDLFLYDDGGHQGVTYYTMRGSQPVDERGCFEELTANARPAPPVS